MQRTGLVAAVLISSVLVGCGSDDDPSTDDADEQIDGEATDAVDADGDDGDVDGDAGETAEDRLGKIDIDQTQTHPNGVELTVHSLRVEQNAIFVDIEAFNGAPFEILLAALDLAAVIDDTGNEYRYEPPEDNEALEIEEAGTLEGSIAFIGRVASDASSVTLRFNYRLDGEPLGPHDAENADFSDAPSFEFTDLPLPGA